MKCSEVMRTNVECCRLDETAAEVAERMRDKNIGFMPVCDASGAVVGTLTDRDLALRVLAERRAGESTLVEEIFTKEVIACKPSDDLEYAEQLMSRHRKSRIVCVDDARRPVGVISLSDIANVEKGARSSEVLRSIAQRESRPH